jgi:protein involved in polysaccharide export with SLBB domain
MGICLSLRACFLAAMVLALGACSSTTVEPASLAAADINDGDLLDYRLGPADKIRLIVYGEPDLSGEFALNARGRISLPLLGEIEAEGLTIDELREKVAAGLSEGYVNDARVAAEIVEYRPYYILGEVGDPGEYPYSAGMTVIKSVAAAGGYTYRANKSAVYIKRANHDEEMKVKLTPDLLVYPGDVIRVGERFF